MSGGITGISLAIVCPPRPVGQWTDLSNLDYAKSRRRAERTRLHHDLAFGMVVMLGEHRPHHAQLVRHIPHMRDDFRKFQAALAIVLELKGAAEQEALGLIVARRV